MKKFQILAALVVSLGGLSVNAHADSQDVESSCSVSSEEREFMAHLSDANKSAFCSMTEEDRMTAMKSFASARDNGQDMTPDQAMDKTMKKQP